jgi:hypothetical protein
VALWSLTSRLWYNPMTELSHHRLRLGTNLMICMKKMSGIWKNICFGWSSTLTTLERS